METPDNVVVMKLPNLHLPDHKIEEALDEIISKLRWATAEAKKALLLTDSSLLRPGGGFNKGHRRFRA